MSHKADFTGLTRFFKFILPVFAVLSAISPAEAAVEAVINTEQNVLHLSSSIQYFKDNTGTPSAPQAFNYFRQNPDNISGADSIVFDKEPATYWLQFSVSNNSTYESWVLSPGRMFDGKNLIFNHFSVYEGDNTTPVAVLSVKSEERNTAQTEGADVNLTIPPGITRTITMRIDTAKGIPLEIAPELVERGLYNKSTADRNMFTGIVFVIGIAFTAVAISLMFMSGLPSLLNFCVYIPSLILFLFAHEGLLNRFNSFIPTSIHQYIYIISYFAVPFFAVLITRNFIDTRENAPQTDAVILLLAGITPLAPVAFIIQDNLHPAVFYLYDYLPQIFFVICTVAGVIFAFMKNLPHSFWMSWLILFGGYNAMFMSQRHVLPENFPVNPSHIFAGAILVHIILLGLSVLFKIKMIMQNRTDIEETQRQMSKRQAEEEAKRNALVRQYENKVKDQEKEYLQELRRQDAARKNELIAAKREAERANEAKSDFLAMISHEIRTPLTGILGMIQLTSQTALTPQQREYIDTVQYSGETLLALLNDILDFSKIEKGKLELEIIGFNLEKLLKSVIMLMSGRAGEKGLALHLKTDEGLPPYIQGDPTRIRQILLNLINNAIKFTERGSVTIHVQKVSDNGKSVELRFNVIDTGIGISPEAKARLFSAYSQADESISRKYGGTGLGLSICKKLVSAMGGRIDITSAVGQGSTFWFVIPMDISEENTAAGNENGKTGEQTAADGKPLRILCIDDNEINLKVLAGLLNNVKNRTTVTETSPVKALDILNREYFDIIFVDMKMPQMNGPEFSSAVRASADKDRASVPIVALTGNASQEDMDICQRAGMNDFLVKPVMTEALNRTIEAVMSGKGRFDTRPVPPPAPFPDGKQNEPQPTIVPWIDDTVPTPAQHINEDAVPVSGENLLSASEKKEPNIIAPLGSPNRDDRI